MRQRPGAGVVTVSRQPSSRGSRRSRPISAPPGDGDGADAEQSDGRRRSSRRILPWPAQAYLDAVWDAVPEGAEPELFAARRAFLLDHVEPGDVVLDVGCGEGAFSAALAGRGARPIAVDVADEPLRRLRARFPEVADVRRATAGEPLPLADGEADLVWAGEVIEHVVDVGAFATELRRSLRPGGPLVLTTPDHTAPPARRASPRSPRLFDEHFWPYADHLRFFTAARCAMVLADAGFDDARHPQPTTATCTRSRGEGPARHDVRRAAGRAGTGVYVERLAARAARRGRRGRRGRRTSSGARRGAGSAAQPSPRTLRWTQVDLRRRAREDADVVHHPLPALRRAAPRPQVVTVHDLAFEALPDAFDPRFAAYARAVHRRAARHADAVVVPARRPRTSCARTGA